MHKYSYLVSVDFSFISVIKIHFTYTFDTLNFILPWGTVALMTEIQALQGEITPIEFKPGY